MAAKNFRKLFEPYTVKSMTLRNRIVMTPIGTNFAEHTGEVNERIIDYYKQRAKGGTGLITIEAASVYSPQGASGAYQLRIDHDNYIPGLYRLCESIHDCGSKVSILLNHAGSAANGKMTNIQPVSASDIPSRVGGDIPRALTTDEIYTIVDKFAEAAKRAVTAGFDAVEIQAGHGYLLNQFLSPTTNDRTDEFGGSKENRARFTTLVLKAVRETVGENIPIFLGISADELAEGGNTLDDTLEIVEYFKDCLDAVVLSTQHDPDITQEQIHEDIKREVFDKILPADMVDDETKFFINPTGRFVIGGPHGDAGLTGRKIIVDTYGGYARHGGGAFSGKDCTKVDRSAAYAARYVAKNIVAAGLAEKCEIQLSYAIGVAEPTSIMVDTFGTGKKSNQELVDLIRKHFDLRPAGIIKMLDLRRPIYKQTAAYGHFGRNDLDLPWERLDKVDLVKGE